MAGPTNGEDKVKRKHIRERKVDSKRLGRHVLHDPASRGFPAEKATQIRTVRHEAQGLPLDQGPLGSCTANALCGALNSAPDNKNTQRTYAEPDAVYLYEVETGLEGDPYPPNDPGGSGLMVCKAAKQLGWIRSYRHAFGIDHALRALVVRPVIFGINWYTTFDQPDQDGLVQISARSPIRGGHEVCADEIDAENELVGFWNSWGLAYGLAGRFYMSFATLERLLEEDGDATVSYPVASFR